MVTLVQVYFPLLVIASIRLILKKQHDLALYTVQ